MSSRNMTSGAIICFSVVFSLFAMPGDARHIHIAATEQQLAQHAESIPSLLLRMYDEMGQDKFQKTWKAFNNRNPDQQDAFLMEGLSDEELDQLGSDFENLAMALSSDPKLMELYADFERNLSIVSFMEMDKKLMHHHGWWGRIKGFLYRKLRKLAQEMITQEAL